MRDDNSFLSATAHPSRNITELTRSLRQRAGPLELSTATAGAGLSREGDRATDELASELQQRQRGRRRELGSGWGRWRVQR